MRIIPLYTWPADPLASHRVVAPGGFERWVITAVNEADAVTLDCTFAFGYPDEEYLWLYRRFLRNPTRVAPPLPAQFPLMVCRITREQRGIIKVFDRLEPQDASASHAAVDVRFGPHRFWRDAAADFRLAVDFAGPSLLKADLRFQSDGEVRRVEGMLHFHAAVGAKQNTVDFRGTGSVAHAFGVSPC